MLFYLLPRRHGTETGSWWPSLHRKPGEKSRSVGGSVAQPASAANHIGNCIVVIACTILAYNCMLQSFSLPTHLPSSVLCLQKLQKFIKNMLYSVYKKKASVICEEIQSQVCRLGKCLILYYSKIEQGGLFNENRISHIIRGKRMIRGRERVFGKEKFAEFPLLMESWSGVWMWRWKSNTSVDVGQISAWCIMMTVSSRKYPCVLDWHKAMLALGIATGQPWIPSKLIWPHQAAIRWGVGTEGEGREHAGMEVLNIYIAFRHRADAILGRFSR